MVMRLVKQIAATGVLLGPFYRINKRKLFNTCEDPPGPAATREYPSSLQVSHEMHPHVCTAEAHWLNKLKNRLEAKNC